MALTAEQILAADDMGLKKIDVPTWGGEVYIRVMSVGERDSYEKLWVGQKDKGIDNFRAEYLARVLCDETGKLLFTRDQIGKFSEKSGAICGRLFDEALKHNNMSQEDVEQLGKG